MQPTQVTRPWQAVARTVFQAVIGLAALFATVTVTGNTPAAVATAVAVSAGITRLMGRADVEAFLAANVPFLAAGPKAGA